MLKSLFQLYKDRLVKGGEGSGRYPAGSGKEKVESKEKIKTRMIARRKEMTDIDDERERLGMKPVFRDAKPKEEEYEEDKRRSPKDYHPAHPDNKMLKTLNQLTNERLKFVKGGAGSGHFGHAGIEGQRGGSAPGEAGAGKERDKLQGVKGLYRKAEGVLRDYNGAVSEYGASSSHARDAIRSSSVNAAEYDIKMHGVESNETISNYSDKDPDTVDRIFWEAHAEQTGKLIEEIQSKYPEITEAGVAGRSGGWLVVGFTDRGEDLDNTMYQIRESKDTGRSARGELRSAMRNTESVTRALNGIPKIVDKHKSELRSKLNSDTWWKERLPIAYAPAEKE